MARFPAPGRLRALARFAGAVGAGGILAASVGACSRAAEGGPDSAVADARPAVGSAGRIEGRGWVVWESNRGGEYRIWRRALEGGPTLPLSPDERGRDHCCAHLSPDGEWVAYLSLPAGHRKYAPPDTVGALHLVPTAGGRDRVLVAAARHYGEHRAALWWSEDELVYIDAAGDTRVRDLSSGAERRIADGPQNGEGFLVDPSGRWATSSTATFSALDPTSGEVTLATPYGGCQAWLAADGATGLWTAGAGGPIDAIELATRRTWTILAKHDPRLPRDRGYLYFPMLSRDRTLLAVAGSNDEHDHFAADYDVLLVELDPATLQPSGRAVEIERHPSIDRYPDVWRDPRTAPARGGRRSAAVAPPAAAGARARAGPGGWPADARALAWIWEGAERANRRAPGAPSELLVERGTTWVDRRGRLALAGGFVEADGESARRVAAELKGSNTVTVELVVEPASLDAAARGPLLALGSGPRQRGLLLTQNGPAIELRVRTGASGPGGGSPALLARLPGGGPHHLAFSYSPGRLRTYLDGQPEATPAWAGDFFPWRARELSLGAESAAAERFRGFVSHVAIFARELGPDEIAADAARALGALARAPAVAGVELDALLESRARLPTLDEISPYRRALVVERWRVERLRSGTLDAATGVRVARWALADGAPTAASRLAPGARARLRLEPYAAQPQLESVYLSEEPPASRPATPLWFDVGFAEGRQP